MQGDSLMELYLTQATVEEDRWSLGLALGK